MGWMASVLGEEEAALILNALGCDKRMRDGLLGI